MSRWQTIDTAPKEGGEEILLGVDVASVWIVRNGWWRSKEECIQSSFDLSDEGWWAYINSVTQEKLDGIFTPTHWAPMPEGQPA